MEPRDVLAGYAIGEVSAVLPAGGTAGKCWRVQATTGSYFLRRRGPRTSSPEALAFDHGLRAHLIRQGLPTAAPLQTREGETWVHTEAGVFELYPLVEGRAYRGSGYELEATARALAHFHQAAACYSARGSYSSVSRQFAVAAPLVGGSERIDDPALLTAAFAGLARGEPGLAYAHAQAEALAAEYPEARYRSLPRYLTHGDYHPGNLLYAETGEVAGVFDLDWACEHTRARDLADGLFFFAGRRARPLDPGDIVSLTEAVDLDLARSVQFLRPYHAVLPLQSAEVAAIPLALRARWLAIRVEGSAKVPPEQRVWFITRDLERPLEWLASYAAELVTSV